MFFPLSGSEPSCTNAVAAPPLALNEKPVATFVPPLSLITSFLTIKAAACVLVYVHVTLAPPVTGISMLASAPLVLVLASPVEVQERLVKLQPEGGVDSVIV